ncbi:MAG: hypothetical protein ACRDRO_09275 [Pseudonocardiaceae bacterium]
MAAETSRHCAPDAGHGRQVVTGSAAPDAGRAAAVPAGIWLRAAPAAAPLMPLSLAQASDYALIKRARSRGPVARSD